jgi:alginate O-acetyltransferase complex protein AlgI
MTFTTFTFIIFLAVVFAAYWQLDRRRQNVLLLAASLVFYGWWDWRFLPILVFSASVDYFAGIVLDRSESATRRKWVLGASLAVNLGTLGFFKYYNFFVESAVEGLQQLGYSADPWTLRVVLPVGISFYTFQSLSYTIDVYRRQLVAVRDPAEFYAFISFFPQLVAGPIERATNLLGQFAYDRKFDALLARDGARQMLWGFFKKMVVADNLAPLVQAAFADPSAASGATLLWATYAFAFQIYCDFSGYTDIAIGCARWFGFELMRNFNFPYFARSVQDFWRRWHISLSTWFRDYLYIPLGGNRRGWLRTQFNILVVFVVSGFWHGANWTFIIWGMLHGVFYLASSTRTGASDQDAASGTRSRLTHLGSVIVTFQLVCLAWVFFRSASVAEALMIIRKIGEAIASGAVALPSGYGKIGFIVPVLALEWLQFRRGQPHGLAIGDLPRGLRWATYYCLTGVILLFANLGHTAFIYFQF